MSPKAVTSPHKDRVRKRDTKMTKKEMIKELVLAWVRNAPTKEYREHRFVDHDTMENRLDRKWTKEGIEFIMKKFREGKNIDILIDKYAF